MGWSTEETVSDIRHRMVVVTIYSGIKSLQCIHRAGIQSTCPRCVTAFPEVVVLRKMMHAHDNTQSHPEMFVQQTTSSTRQCLSARQHRIVAPFFVHLNNFISFYIKAFYIFEHRSSTANTVIYNLQNSRICIRYIIT